MITSLLLAACLAQAEPAPVESAPPPPGAAVDPGPAEAAPPTPPGEKSAASSPPPATAPAAPAPASGGTTVPTSPSAGNIVSILGGLATRLGTAPSTLGPTLGFSVGASFQRRYLALSPALELGLAVDFLFDRFSAAVQGSAMVAPGVEQTYDSTRTLTETSFGALQTLGVRAGAMHAWLGAGGGLAVGFFSTPEIDLRPGTTSAYQPFVRGAVGADITLNDQTSVGVRAGYSFMLTSPSFTTNLGNRLELFGDLLDIHAGLFYRFR